MSQFNWKIQERPINSNVVGTGLKLRTLLLKVQQPPPWPRVANALIAYNPRAIPFPKLLAKCFDINFKANVRNRGTVGKPSHHQSSSIFLHVEKSI
jgi:hypothetical protein